MTKVRENLESRIKNILEEIRELDAEISKIKAEIEEEKQKLVVHYHNLLREGKDTRSEGLVWIIKAIWRLKKTILPTFLPNFLDDELIRFILSYTKDVIKLEQLNILTSK